MAQVVSLNGVASIDQQKPRLEKKRRYAFRCIETLPRPTWFIKATDERGKTVWYTRLEITGLLPRRYGPFQSRSDALQFLDCALEHLGDPLSSIESCASDFVVSRRFQTRDFCCEIVEDSLASAYLRKSRKGGLTHGG